jgi:hypothetical protein
MTGCYFLGGRMIKMFLKIVFLLSSIGLGISGCSLLPASVLHKKVDPYQKLSSDNGFQFSFPMSGEWFRGNPSPIAQYMAGKEPAPDGTTTLAFVRYGPVWTPNGKAITNKEIFDSFKRDLEKDAKSGRATDVKTQFSNKKYSGAECLSFQQSGQDHPASGSMDMSNDGIICLHPKRPYQFIWLSISERRPLGKPPYDKFADDKKQFFNSLQFID